MPYYKELLFSLFAWVSFKVQLNSSALVLSLYHVEALLQVPCTNTLSLHWLSAFLKLFVGWKPHEGHRGEMLGGSGAHPWPWGVWAQSGTCRCLGRCHPTSGSCCMWICSLLAHRLPGADDGGNAAKFALYCCWVCTEKAFSGGAVHPSNAGSHCRSAGCWLSPRVPRGCCDAAPQVGAEHIKPKP